MPFMVTGKPAGSSPAVTSGRSVAIGPCGQQPGLATSFAPAIAFAWLAVHLGKAVGPAFGDAVRRRGVDHARGVVADQRHALARRIVGQAQDGDVGGVQEVGAGGRILAPLGWGSR